MKRPLPPSQLINAIGDLFMPAPAVWEWVRSTFLDRSSKLFNPEHWHLSVASVGVLWTNAENTRQQRRVVGMVNLPKPASMVGAWEKAKYRQQLREWFGHAPLDYLITLDATYAIEVPDAAFCALIEHELYHCAQKLDEYGAPKFTKEGRPVYTLRGHDVEEFIGVVRRYGARSAAGGVDQLVAAARQKPEVAAASIAGACGTCLARR